MTSVALAAAGVSADVIGGDALLTPPSSALAAISFTASDGEATLSLVLNGKVATQGEATYWCETEAGAVQVTGPALVRVQEDVSAKTGVIVVRARRCNLSGPAPAGFDWHGQCKQPAAGALTLAHGDALLFSDVFPYNGAAKDCVNASIDQYQSGTVFSNVTPASETNGAPASGSVVHGGAFADVSADTADANGKAESVGIEIVCWVVDPDAKVVARFEFVAPADQFEAEVKAFKKVVQTVKI